MIAPLLQHAPRLAEEVAGALASAPAAQSMWARTPLKERLRVIRRFRWLLAAEAESLVGAINSVHRESPTESMMEVLALADACRFVEKNASRILAMRRARGAGRPLWLGRGTAEILREPFGVVLIVAPGNYPLMLPGIQLVQALAAGNAVLFKPGSGGRLVAGRMLELLGRAGLPAGLVSVLAESAAAGEAAIEAGVDLVVLTGSASTGREVLARLAPRLTPAIVELSGCDSVFILPSADLQLAASSLRFGICYNGSATCIAPRRVFVPINLAGELERRLAEQLRDAAAMPVSDRRLDQLNELVGDAIDAGARIACGQFPVSSPMRPLVLAGVRPDMAIAQADLMAPVLSILAVMSIDEAIAADRSCPYALGSSIFGDVAEARALATHLRAGIITINDLIVPTADPRLPFGGAAQSGFGVTRGAEGLLALTRPRVVTRTPGRFRPHLRPVREGDERLFQLYLAAAHGGGWRNRFRNALALLRALLRRGSE